MSPAPAHPITSTASLVRLALVLVAHPRLGIRFLRVLWTTWRRFFLPQSGPWRSARTRQVAMDLDRHFRFDAAWYPCYMGFTRLWMGSLGWLHRRFGRRAVPDIEAFLAGLETLFVEAHKVYARCQSTVSGPGLRPAGTPLAIRLFDPNLHCLPSTHVMIVGYNAWRLAAILGRLRGPGEDFAAEAAFVRDRAQRVVESIVHVKQHSLGDIAPALLLLDSLGFGPSREANLDFLDGLFHHLPAAEGEPVRAFLKAAYERLSDRREAGEAAVPLLLAFLENYDREVESLLAGPASEPAPASISEPQAADLGASLAS
jgi:hypothetical protein